MSRKFLQNVGKDDFLGDEARYQMIRTFFSIMDGIILFEIDAHDVS